jgi:hypothetical protein
MSAAGLAACGGSEDSGAGELARQRELAAARHQAALDARQGARIRGLERQLERSGRPVSVAPSPNPPARSVPKPAADLGDWPGGSGYTAILASDSSQSQARGEQARASGRGVSAGVLYSTSFSSLRPGYWVVFSGTFASESEAVSRVSRAEELGYVDAYPRFVSP